MSSSSYKNVFLVVRFKFLEIYGQLTDGILEQSEISVPESARIVGELINHVVPQRDIIQQVQRRHILYMSLKKFDPVKKKTKSQGTFISFTRHRSLNVGKYFRKTAKVFSERESEDGIVKVAERRLELRGAGTVATNVEGTHARRA